MRFAQIFSSVVLAGACLFTAVDAHAIAYPEPSAKQVKSLESTVKARIVRTAVYKNAAAQGAKLSFSFQPGTPTIGPDRSQAAPVLKAFLIGPSASTKYAVFASQGRSYAVTEGANNKFRATVQGKWQRLLTATSK